MRKVAESLAGRATVLQVNTDDSPELAGRFGVRGIPVLFLLVQGRNVDQLAGVHTADSVLSWFRRLEPSSQ